MLRLPSPGQTPSLSGRRDRALLTLATATAVSGAEDGKMGASRPAPRATRPGLRRAATSMGCGSYADRKPNV